MDISETKAIKNIEDPKTFFTKVKHKYWDLQNWFRSTDIGMWYYVHIEWKYLYPLRCWFNPRHKKLRNSIPKKWCDSTELVRIINFAIITEFYEDEFTSRHIDWDADDAHKEFAQWLKESYKYITVIRPNYEKEMWASYPKHDKTLEECGGDFNKYFNQDSHIPYEVKYEKVIYWENLIESRDKQILVDLITKYRGFLWT